MQGCYSPPGHQLHKDKQQHSDRHRGLKEGIVKTVHVVQVFTCANGTGASGERGYLCTIWQVSHGGEEGVLGIEDASLAHVPDLEASHQARHQNTWLTP